MDPERRPLNFRSRIPGWNLILNGFFFFGVSLFFVGGLFTLPRWIYSPVQQPIQFDHNKHKQAGLACVDCHATALEQANAGLPDLGTCMTCHESAITESKEEEKIRATAAGGGELGWKPVTRLPKDIYFSHRRHAKLANLDCIVCHGPVGESVKPPSRPAVPMMMNNCLDCHRKRRANVDCYACHR